MCHHLLTFNQSPKSKTAACCTDQLCLIQGPVWQHVDHVEQVVEGLELWAKPDESPDKHRKAVYACMLMDSGVHTPESIPSSSLLLLAIGSSDLCVKYG